MVEITRWHTDHWSTPFRVAVAPPTRADKAVALAFATIRRDPPRCAVCGAPA